MVSVALTNHIHVSQAIYMHVLVEIQNYMYIEL